MVSPNRRPQASRRDDELSDEGRRSAVLSRPLSRVSKFSSPLESLPVTTFGKEDRKMSPLPLPIRQQLRPNSPSDPSRSSDAAADFLLGVVLSNRSSSSAAHMSKPRAVSSSAWAAPKTHVASTGNMAAADYLAARPWAATPVPDAVDYACLLRGGPQQGGKGGGCDEAAKSDAPTSVISRPSDSLAAATKPSETTSTPARPRMAEIIFRAKEYAAWNGPRCRGVDGKPLSTFGVGHPSHVQVATLAGPGAYKINTDDIGDIPKRPSSTLQGPARGPITLTRTGLIGNCKSPSREAPSQIAAPDKIKSSHARGVVDSTGGATNSSICRSSGTKNAQLREQERRRRKNVLLV